MPPWFTRRVRLPERIEGDGLVLRRWRVEDAELLHEAVVDSVEHLRPWIPWSRTSRCPSGSVVPHPGMGARWEGGGDVVLTIVRDEVVAGGSGCTGARPGALEISYWLRPGFVGRGIVTTAARLVTTAASQSTGSSEEGDWHEPANTASGAVPARLGFSAVGDIDATVSGGRPATNGPSYCRMREAHRIPLVRALAGAPGSQTPPRATRSQTIELAVAAEELGIDGAFVRVHHFARQLASPFPLLAAIGARTSRIEIGTGVIDMRYENPLYMAEEAAAADLSAAAGCSSASAAARPSRRCAAPSRSASSRPRARPTPTSRAPRPSCSAPRSPARGSRAPTRAGPVRPATARRSSRSRRAWPTASGGARAPARPPRGRPSRA